MKILGLAIASALSPLLAGTSATAADINGNWARGDGKAKVLIAPCGEKICATNTWIKPGTQNPHRHPSTATNAPTTRNVSPSPMECAVLHRLYTRPRSRLLNQAVMATTLAGAPKLWNQPFRPHSSTDNATVVEKPIPTLHSAVNKKPNARNRLMLA